MRTVKAKKFREYFRKNGSDEFDYTAGFDWDRFFYHHRTRFNRQWVVLFLLISFFLLSIYRREGWVLLISAVIGLTGIFYRTRAIARGLYPARRIPSRAKKNQSVEAEYEIRNASEFEISHLAIRDFFTGTRAKTITFAVSDPVNPLSYRKFRENIPCDAGMGVHTWGPLVVTVTDPLGIFEFTVTEDEPAILPVLPGYLFLDDFQIPDSLDTSAVGVNESVRAGHSSNFLGLREYVPGDSIKRINWKLSARHQELVVNVFENMVHTDLTVCVDMAAGNHIGRPGDNTWEMCKDAAVAILRDQYPQTHRMQFFSQGAGVPFDRGDAHLLLMTQSISGLEPRRAEYGEVPLLEKILPSIPYGSSLIYITPVYLNDPGEISRMLTLLQESAVRCAVILVVASDFIQSLPPGLTHQVVYGSNEAAKENYDQILRRNGQLGIPTYVIKRSQSLARSLATPVVR